MTNPNDPAFPLPLGNENVLPEVAGLTKREWLAGLAMQGILANLQTFEQGRYSREGVPVTPSVTILAVDVADMLIAELNKQEK